MARKHQNNVQKTKNETETCSYWIELCQVSWSNCVAELAVPLWVLNLCELSVSLVAVHVGVFASRAPGLARRSARV